jgi:phage baseplate assembly protein W
MVAEPVTIPEIDWGATGTAALRQCVACLLATPAGTVPLAREQGLTHGLGESVAVAVAGARMRARVVRAFARYEPRVVITAVSVDGASTGDLTPTVTWRPA